jgi:membrane carboxypeptidase/penicillin-binding protein PbpC
MRKRLAKYLVVVAALSITIGILDRVFPPDQSRYREASVEILARDGEPLRVFTTRDGMLRLATFPDDVDPRYLNLLLQVEDRHFWRHSRALVSSFRMIVGRRPCRLHSVAWASRCET